MDSAKFSKVLESLGIYSIDTEKIIGINNIDAFKAIPWRIFYG